MLIKRGFVLVLFAVILSSLVVADTFNGQVQPTFPSVPNLFSVVPSSQCIQSRTILKLSDTTNAHVALYTNTFYPYALCFNRNPSSSVRTPLGRNELVRLSDTTNAQAELPDPTFSMYSQPIYYSNLDCGYSAGGNACVDGKSCALKLIGGTNAHVASCDAPSSAYPISVCCRVDSQQTSCQWNSDCSSGRICVNSLCVQDDGDNDIPPNNIPPGSVGSPCTTVANCNQGLECTSGLCRRPGDLGSICNIDSECNAPLRCDIGLNECIEVNLGEPPLPPGPGTPPECTENSRCGDGKTCANQKCLSCTNDEDNDQILNCQDDCPFVPGETCGNRDVLSSCEDLDGVDCSMGESCINGRSSRNTYDSLNCCIPTSSAGKASCGSTQVDPRFGGAPILREEGQCEYDGYSGRRKVTLSVKGATNPIDGFDINDLVLLGEVPPGAQVDGQGRIIYYVDCVPSSVDSSRNAPFFSIFSVGLFALLLIGYYFVRHRKL